MEDGNKMEELETHFSGSMFQEFQEMLQINCLMSSKTKSGETSMGHLRRVHAVPWNTP